VKVVFCIYNFINEKLPLQPWLTINQIAIRLKNDGHDVHIITDTQDDSSSTLRIHVIKSLRASNKDEIFAEIDEIDPDVLVTLITPLNLATGGWVSRYKRANLVAFSSYPFYSFMELFRAFPHIKFIELKSYIRHLLVPGFLWKRTLKQNFTSVICQSESGRNRLIRLLKSTIPVYSIPPGINLDEWRHTNLPDSESAILKLLYLGTASEIRGFDICLKAYNAVSGLDISLTILARGASPEDEKTIAKKLESLNSNAKTKLLGGWIDKAELLAYINKSDLIILPFVLVPSELPVSVMEVIACGTPVITTNIDGLPSTVGSAGAIVKQGSYKSLVNAITVIYNNREKLLQLTESCSIETAKMYSWDVMYDKWLEKLNVTNQ
jgi:glycosyltransferase involved in cell wall biosynthesis